MLALLHQRAYYTNAPRKSSKVSDVRDPTRLLAGKRACLFKPNLGSVILSMLSLL